jgi:hypothetical protein
MLDHITRIVQDYLQQEAIELLPWSALARNHALLRRLLTVRLLMLPLSIHWLRSVFVVLNGSCLASLLRSLSSLGVIFNKFKGRVTERRKQEKRSLIMFVVVF